MVSHKELESNRRVCSPAQWLDASVEEINATGWPLRDLNRVGWAQAARAATDQRRAGSTPIFSLDVSAGIAGP